MPLQKELNLYVDKNGTVWDLLQEAANEVGLYPLPPSPVRTLPTRNFMILSLFPPSVPLSLLSFTSSFLPCLPPPVSTDHLQRRQCTDVEVSLILPSFHFYASTLTYHCNAWYRLVEVMTHRIIEIHPFDKPVSELYVQRIYRVEVSHYLTMGITRHNIVYLSMCTSV